MTNLQYKPCKESVETQLYEYGASEILKRTRGNNSKKKQRWIIKRPHRNISVPVGNRINLILETLVVSNDPKIYEY